jgi:hypothetical protein
MVSGANGTPPPEAAENRRAASLAISHCRLRPGHSPGSPVPAGPAATDSSDRVCQPGGLWPPPRHRAASGRACRARSTNPAPLTERQKATDVHGADREQPNGANSRTARTAEPRGQPNGADSRTAQTAEPRGQPNRANSRTPRRLNARATSAEQGDCGGIRMVVVPPALGFTMPHGHISRS